MQVEIQNYRKIDKGALAGSFTLVIHPWGIKIFKCKHFIQGEGSWFNYPQEEIKKPGEKSDYFPSISFGTGEIGKEIKEQTLKALENYGKFSTNQGPKSAVSTESPFSFQETPF